MMNKNELASILDGREYNKEISEKEEQLAKENRLVVVFGASDDLMEFRGAIYDETYEKTNISKNGILKRPDIEDYDPDYNEQQSEQAMEKYDKDFEAYLSLKKQGGYIIPVWNDDNSEFCCYYQTNIPHAIFRIFDEKEPYCKGIIFSLDELEKA